LSSEKKKKKSKESGLSGHTLIGSILKRDFSCGRALGRLLPFNVTRLTPRSHWPFKKGSHNSHLSFEEKTSPRLKSCSFFPFHFVNYLCEPSGNPEAAPKQLDGVRWEGVYKQCAPLETCPCLPSWSTKISPSSLAHQWYHHYAKHWKKFEACLPSLEGIHFLRVNGMERNARTSWLSAACFSRVLGRDRSKLQPFWNGPECFLRGCVGCVMVC